MSWPSCLPWVIVDGVSWLDDEELAWGGVQRWSQQGIQEAGVGAGVLASLEATAPAHIRVASKHPPTCSLERERAWL